MMLMTSLKNLTWTIVMTPCAMDLDVALILEKPAKTTEESSHDDRAFYDNWERSNRLCLNMMWMNPFWCNLS
uniref:Uncharacterized protein n=1 Tax=Arundo donax TaxID=35708 RepID=A0A0A9DSY5_ARUDO